MRNLARVAGAALAVTALSVAAPAAAFAESSGDRFDRDDDGLIIDLGVAAAADVDLGDPAVLPLCFGDRYQVTVIDRFRDTRTTHCVDADVAADLDAVVAVR